MSPDELPAPPCTRIVDESIGYKRYVKVYQRSVEFASDPPTTVSYDIVGHDRVFTQVVPYCTSTSTFALVREYVQGADDFLFLFPGGAFEPEKHRSVLHAAQAELSEEARLTSGKWHSLLTGDQPAIHQVKWCSNRFVPFLVVDPVADPRPQQRDIEEAHMEVISGVTREQVLELISSGKMMNSSCTSFFLALAHLERLDAERK